MSERIVDALEMIEVETENRHGFRAPQAAQDRFHLLIERDAVQQVRERVVTRQMPDPFLGQKLLGDVLERRDEPATRHAPKGVGNSPAVAQEFDKGFCLGSTEDLLRMSERVLGVHKLDSRDRSRERHELRYGHALQVLVLRQPENLGEARIEQRHLALCIEHQEALRHVRQRGLKFLPGGGKGLFRLLFWVMSSNVATTPPSGIGRRCQQGSGRRSASGYRLLPRLHGGFSPHKRLCPRGPHPGRPR